MRTISENHSLALGGPCPVDFLILTFFLGGDGSPSTDGQSKHSTNYALLVRLFFAPASEQSVAVDRFKETSDKLTTRRRSRPRPRSRTTSTTRFLHICVRTSSSSNLDPSIMLFFGRVVRHFAFESGGGDRRTGRCRLFVIVIGGMSVIVGV